MSVGLGQLHLRSTHALGGSENFEHIGLLVLRAGFM